MHLIGTLAPQMQLRSVRYPNGERTRERPISRLRAADQATLDVVTAKSCLRSQFQAGSGSKPS